MSFDACAFGKPPSTFIPRKPSNAMCKSLAQALPRRLASFSSQIGLVMLKQASTSDLPTRTCRIWEQEPVGGQPATILRRVAPLPRDTRLAAARCWRVVRAISGRAVAGMVGCRSGRGAFIVLEGVDRSGKSTQSEKLVKKLIEAGVTFVLSKQTRIFVFLPLASHIPSA